MVLVIDIGICLYYIPINDLYAIQANIILHFDTFCSEVNTVQVLKKKDL